MTINPTSPGFNGPSAASSNDACALDSTTAPPTVSGAAAATAAVTGAAATGRIGTAGTPGAVAGAGFTSRLFNTKQSLTLTPASFNHSARSVHGTVSISSRRSPTTSIAAVSSIAIIVSTTSTVRSDGLEVDVTDSQQHAESAARSGSV